MKTLFSFFAIVFLVWVGIVYALPQSGYLERAHSALEKRLSRTLAADVAIESLALGIFPRPYLSLEQIRIKRQHTELVSIEHAKAVLNLSAFVSSHIHWFELELNEPSARFAFDIKNKRGLRDFLSENNFLAPLLAFHFVKINKGTIHFNNQKWHKVNGHIAAGRAKPIESELRFVIKEKSYLSTLSLASLNGNKPIAMVFSISARGNKLKLDGVWQDKSFRQFDGSLLWHGGAYSVRAAKVRVATDSYRLTFDETEIKAPNWTLTGEGSGDIAADLSKANFILTRAQLEAGGDVFGEIEMSAALITAKLTFKHPQLELLLQKKGFAVSDSLGGAHLKVELLAKAGKLVSLKADGAIGASAVRLNFKEGSIISKWQADNGKLLLKQFGLPSALVSASPASVFWKLKQSPKENYKFGILVRSKKTRYLAQGKLNKQDLAFNGKIKFRNTWSRGKGDIALKHKQFSLFLTLDSLLLDKLLAAPITSFLDKNASGNLAINARRMRYGRYSFSAVKTQLYVSSDHIRVKSFQSKFARGRLDAAADWSMRNNKPHYALALKLTQADSARLAQDLFNKRFVKGKLSLTTSLSANGKSKQELLRTLSGHGSIAIGKGALLGFDASLLNQSLPQLELFSFLTIVIDYAFNHGTTNFDYGQTRFRIEHGKLHARPFQFGNDNLVARLAFGADFVAQKMQASFKFKMPLKPNYPPLGWQLSGTWDSPKQNFESQDLEAALAQDIIDGGIEEIKNRANQQTLPLQLQDLLREARKKNDIDDALDLDLQIDLAS